MDPHRKAWNQGQQALRKAISHGDEHAKAIELFLSQHAMVHAADLDALRAYRLAVGRRTRQIVTQLSPEALKQKVNPSRLKRLMDEGALIEAAHGLIDYWGSLSIAGLLLMPPTRHNFVHLNEALRVKKKCLSVR